jgi:hypothetical protein
MFVYLYLPFSAYLYTLFSTKKEDDEEEEYMYLSVILLPNWMDCFLLLTSENTMQLPSRLLAW